MYRAISIAITCTALSACGGSSDQPQPSNNTQVSISDYETLTKTEIEAKVLKSASAAELETHLKNGIRLNVQIGTDDRTFFDAVPLPQATPSPASAEADASAGATTGNFSQTNTHVRGVDESDFVKYDGQHIFMATHPYYIWGEDQPDAVIRILETDSQNAEVEEIASIPVSDDAWGGIGELYLTEGESGAETMVTLRESWNQIAAADTSLASDDIWIWPAPLESHIQIRGYDVSDAANPSASYKIEIDGYLQNSRKIGDTLYLVSNYSPYLPHINYYFETDEAAEENERLIADLTLEDLLPSVRINDGDEQPLFEASDCLVPVELTDKHGYQSVVSIIAIDLNDASIQSAKCLNTHVSGIYASQDSLYLGGSSVNFWESWDSFTVIHKFTLDEAINYRSTGSVQGTLGWDDPSFRMDEHDGHLRVVTTSRDDEWRPEHSLTILRDDDSSDEMVRVSELPNEANPEPIGKPNEDIYAVRFNGDQAFIVTFERIDPLYVLNLEDEQNPSISGELEVPGFSTYLHPVNNTYLLGVGRDANDQGIAGGVKVSLFDISDMSAPSLVASETFGDRGSHSAALYDLRALSFLATNDDQLRFTLPISTFTEQWTWQDEALHLFEINGLASNSAQLDFIGKMISESAGGPDIWYSFWGFDRGLLHDDAVFYVHGNSVWTAFWNTPDNVSGPH